MGFGQLAGIPNWFKNKIDELTNKVDKNENDITKLNNNLIKYNTVAANNGTGHNSNAEYITICEYTVLEKGLYFAESYAGGFNYVNQDKRVIVRVCKRGSNGVNENFHSEENVHVQEHFGIKADSLFLCNVGDVIICYLYSSVADTNAGNIYYGKITRIL